MRRAAHLWMISGSLGLLVGACALLAPGAAGPEEATVPGRPASFPHAIHMEAELACTDCHPGAETEARAGMPDLETCFLCHDEEADAEVPREQTPQGFILPGDEEPTWTRVTATAVPTTFSHARHSGADCATCHPGVAESEAVSTGWHVDMQQCQECHASFGVTAQSCEDCHPGVGPQWQPDSHRDDWERIHGRVAPFAELAATPSQDCSLCHKESQCRSCHTSTTPADHTEPFRIRAHGFAASLDRDRCQICHRDDSCVRCHRQTVPVSHNAIWGGRTSAHCATCHLPLDSSDGCTVCHAGTPSHRLAPRRPAPPHPGPTADCRSCHFPLTHFDNGQDCNLCHR